MLQANPALTPNLVKAILAVHRRIARRLQRADAGRRLPQRARRGRARAVAASRRRPWPAAARRRPVASDPTRWSRHIDLGQPPHRRRPAARRGNAWRTDVIWGSAGRPRAERRRGARARATARGTSSGTATTATTSSGAPATDGDNIVWGTECGGATATTSSGARPRRRHCEHRLGHRRPGDNIVWGTDRATDERRQHRLGHQRPRRNRQCRVGRVRRSGRRSRILVTDPRAPMKALPLAARIYVCAIIGVGAALLVAFFPDAFRRQPAGCSSACCCCRRSPRSSR